MPDFWTILGEALNILWRFLTEYSSAVGAGLIAAIVALCSSYNADTKTFNFVESVMCGFIGVSLHPLLMYLNLPPELAIFIACCVGFVGTVTVRKLLLAFVDRYTSRNK